MLGTREFLVIHHTDCGSHRYSNEDLYRVLEEQGIDADGYDFLPITDLEESVREDVERIATSPLMLPGIPVTGLIFDVQEGLLHRVCEAETAGPAAAARS
jgi:carbonic anhydrase